MVYTKTELDRLTKGSLSNSYHNNHNHYSYLSCICSSHDLNLLRSVLALLAIAYRRVIHHRINIITKEKTTRAILLNHHGIMTSRLGVYVRVIDIYTCILLSLIHI